MSIDDSTGVELDADFNNVDINGQRGADRAMVRGKTCSGELVATKNRGGDCLGVSNSFLFALLLVESSGTNLFLLVFASSALLSLRQTYSKTDYL